LRVESRPNARLDTFDRENSIFEILMTQQETASSKLEDGGFGAQFIAEG
jgi:hypothetical protein